jgi:hypothetical protein
VGDNQQGIVAVTNKNTNIEQQLDSKRAHAPAGAPHKNKDDQHKHLKEKVAFFVVRVLTTFFPLVVAPPRGFLLDVYTSQYRTRAQFLHSLLACLYVAASVPIKVDKKHACPVHALFIWSLIKTPRRRGYATT